MSDEHWMELAIEQAREVEGITAPNPPVGCVIVKDGEIIAKGSHKGAGLPHAECDAINQLTVTETQGATAYVTLEPCSTKGKTGACTDVLIANKIARVVYGSKDPNPDHAGKADTILNEKGIEVVSGVLGMECDQLIESFRKWILQGDPYVIAKAGSTLDGRIQRPKGESQWITSSESRQDAQDTLRAKCDAILIGAETARVDNPTLTFRGDFPKNKPQPLRVVLTKSGDLPKDLKLFTDIHKDRTLVYQNQPIKKVLKDLAKKGVLTVLAEGGSQIHRELFAGDHVDEVVFYLAPRIAGGGASSVGGMDFPEDWGSVSLRDIDVKTIGDDVRFSGKVRKMKSATFFDRDGVINVPITEGGGYVLRVEDFQFQEGAMEAVLEAKKSGPVILITNQKCVAKGLVTEEQLEQIHQYMQDHLLEKVGVNFDSIYACTDDPSDPNTRYKPSPAMFEEASLHLGIDLQSSIMIGDQDRDIEAAINAEVGITIRVLEEGDPKEIESDYTVKSVSKLPDLLSQLQLV